MSPIRYSTAVDSRDPGHIHFRLFVNGALSGSLVMTPEEYRDFCMAIGFGVAEQVFRRQIGDEEAQ